MTTVVVEFFHEPAVMGDPGGSDHTIVSVAADHLTLDRERIDRQQVKAEAERWVPHAPGPTCQKSWTSLGSALPDPQVAQQPLERLLVAVVLLPAPEVADVAVVPQLARPRLARAEHRVVEPDREQHEPAAPLRVQDFAATALARSASHSGRRTGLASLVISAADRQAGKPAFPIVSTRRLRSWSAQ